MPSGSGASSSSWPLARSTSARQPGWPVCPVGPPPCAAACGLSSSTARPVAGSTSMLRMAMPPMPSECASARPFSASHTSSRAPASPAAHSQRPCQRRAAGCVSACAEEGTACAVTFSRSTTCSPPPGEASAAWAQCASTATAVAAKGRGMCTTGFIGGRFSGMESGVQRAQGSRKRGAAQGGRAVRRCRKKSGLRPLRLGLRAVAGARAACSSGLWRKAGRRPAAKPSAAKALRGRGDAVAFDGRSSESVQRLQRLQCLQRLSMGMGAQARPRAACRARGTGHAGLGGRQEMDVESALIQLLYP